MPAPWTESPARPAPLDRVAGLAGVRRAKSSPPDTGVRTGRNGAADTGGAPLL